MKIQLNYAAKRPWDVKYYPHGQNSYQNILLVVTDTFNMSTRPNKISNYSELKTQAYYYFEGLPLD